MVCVSDHAGHMQDTRTRSWRGEDVMGRQREYCGEYRSRIERES